MPGPTRVGEVIAGKYRVDRMLGAGGMGLVVEAHHLTLDEKVAIKYLKPEAPENTAAVARFAREAKAAARIKSEHVCRVLDVVVDGGMPYLIMEYLQGRDLDDLVEKDGALSVEDGIDYVLQACEALAEAHVAGIVHRDLKPANLFLSRRADGSPVVKVLDFGISKLQPKPGVAEAAMTATSSLLGSPLYMSPEQMKAIKDVDARTDIWSMGVILYEILTGERPFVGETIPTICAMILSEPPIPLAGRVPTEVDAVIMKCLEKRPDDRFQTVAELAEALRPIAAPRSVLSIDRVVRVIHTRSGSGSGDRAPFPGPPLSQTKVSAGVPNPPAAKPLEPWASATVDASSVDAPLPLLHAAPTTGNGPAGTHAAFSSRVTERPSRAGRVVLAAGLLLTLAGGIAAFVAMCARPHPPKLGAPSSTAAAVTAEPEPLPAVPPPTASAVADVATPPSASAAALVASAPGGPRPRPGVARPPPPPRPTGLALPPPPAPAPVKSGFGGRD